MFYFLLLRMRPERGEFWQPVTGGVESGEALAAAALREAKEETGLEFPSLPSPIAEPFEFERPGVPRQTFREFSFSLSLPHQSAFPEVHLDPNEHTDFQWVTAKEALQRVGYPSNAQVLESLLRRLVQE